MPKTMDFYLPKSMENSLPLTPEFTGNIKSPPY